MFSKTRSLLILLTALVLLPLTGRTETNSAISDEECTKLGESIATDLSTGKADEAVRSLDQFALADRVIAGLGLSDQDASAFRSGLLSKLSGGLTQQLKNYSSARFLRIQKVAGEKRLLIRCLSEAGAVNHLSLVTGRREGGSVRWVDAYVYLSGELISESMHRAVLPIFAEQQKGLLEKLTSTESEYMRNFAKIGRAVKLITAGQHADALALFAEMPASLQREHFILTMRLRAAQNVNDAEYLKVITDWEQAYPNDAALDLVSIDGDLLRKDYAHAIRHVDSLNHQLGGDPYLTYLKANINFMAENYQAARAFAREALAAEPSLAPAWDVLLSSSIKEKNYPETAALLVEFSESHPHSSIKKVIDEAEGYAEFRASPEYAK